MRAITLANFRPSRRADGEQWVSARIEEADEATGKWEELELVALDPLDEDPSRPVLRSFTVDTEKPWLRIVFLDAGNSEDIPSPIAYTAGGPQFRPTVEQVSGILRARTYTDDGEDTVGGELLGEFSEDTTPNIEQIENVMIPDATLDVSRTASRVPGEMLDQARRVAALGVAKDIERSYLPEQAEPGSSIFQSLRITYEGDLKTLSQNLHYWNLANRGLL